MNIDLLAISMNVCAQTSRTKPCLSHLHIDIDLFGQCILGSPKGPFMKDLMLSYVKLPEGRVNQTMLCAMYSEPLHKKYFPEGFSALAIRSEVRYNFPNCFVSCVWSLAVIILKQQRVNTAACDKQIIITSWC